jgi:hypothetical protein
VWTPVGTLARHAHRQSFRSLLAFEEARRRNPSIPKEDLEPIEGAIIGSGKLPEGFLDAKARGMDLRVSDSAGSWLLGDLCNGLRIDKVTHQTRSAGSCHGIGPATRIVGIEIRGYEDPARAQAVLAGTRPAILRCHVTARATNPDFELELKATIRVGARGEVRVTLEPRGALDRRAIECVRTLLRSAPFPAPAKGTATIVAKIQLL